MDRPTRPDPHAEPDALKAGRAIGIGTVGVTMITLAFAVLGLVGGTMRADKAEALHRAVPWFLDAALFAGLMAGCLWVAGRCANLAGPPRHRGPTEGKSASERLRRDRAAKRLHFAVAGAVICLGFTIGLYCGGVYRTITDERGALLPSDASPDHG